MNFIMVDELEHKYEVKVQTREGRQKLPEQSYGKCLV